MSSLYLSFFTLPSTHPAKNPQPIYLTWKLRHNTGNTPGGAVHGIANSCGDPIVVPTSTSCKTANDADDVTNTHRPLRKVISINGEEVNALDLKDINIHDYASFEHTEHVGSKFMSSIKRRDGARMSFKNVVKDVIRRERIMRALRHYTHRSDSETEDTDEEVFKHGDGATGSGAKLAEGAGETAEKAVATAPKAEAQEKVETKVTHVSQGCHTPMTTSRDNNNEINLQEKSADIKNNVHVESDSNSNIKSNSISTTNTKSDSPSKSACHVATKNSNVDDSADLTVATNQNVDSAPNNNNPIKSAHENDVTNQSSQTESSRATKGGAKRKNKKCTVM